MESDYHDAMNAECYEKYFENVCKLLKPRSVIIIDNASYHSRNDENYPISTWRKAKYQEWLQKNNVTYGTDALSNKTNDLILNLAPENVTQHSRIE